MADIPLAISSTVGTTNIYTINPPVLSQDRYYIQLNDSSNWIVRINFAGNCFGTIKESLQDGTTLRLTYSINNINPNVFDLIIVRSTRIWFTDLVIPVGGQITIETKTIIA